MKQFFKGIMQMFGIEFRTALTLVFSFLILIIGLIIGIVTVQISLICVCAFAIIAFLVTFLKHHR